MGEVAVSVVCTTYNQDSYIAQCLDSLVSQKTTFPYEVIVHDDCSSDGTADIVRQFAKEHPDKVVALLEDENQYSKGGTVLDDAIAPHIRGDYVAVCEGDDWWVSDAKLQKQYDYMESHPETAACVHEAKVFDDEEKRYSGYWTGVSTERDYSTEEIISSIAPFATNSMFFKAEYWSVPGAFQNWGIGDYPKSIWFSTKGRFHYDPSVMSAYRRNAKGSWSVETYGAAETILRADNKIVEGLEAFDIYSGNRYSEAVQEAIGHYRLEMALARRDWKAVRSNPKYQSFPLKKKIANWLKCKNPKLAESIKRAIK